MDANLGQHPEAVPGTIADLSRGGPNAKARGHCVLPTAAEGHASGAAASGGGGGEGSESAWAAKARAADLGRSWGEGATRCFVIKGDLLDEGLSPQLEPVPESFVCPISQSTMVDPVCTADGCAYEREQIERWVRERRQQRQTVTSPVTGLALRSTTLMPLVALQTAIETFLKHSPALEKARKDGRALRAAVDCLEKDLQERGEKSRIAEEEVARLQRENATLRRALQQSDATCEATRFELVRTRLQVAEAGTGGATESAALALASRASAYGAAVRASSSVAEAQLTQVPLRSAPAASASSTSSSSVRTDEEGDQAKRDVASRRLLDRDSSAPLPPRPPDPSRRSWQAALFGAVSTTVLVAALAIAGQTLISQASNPSRAQQEALPEQLPVATAPPLDIVEKSAHTSSATVSESLEVAPADTAGVLEEAPREEEPLTEALLRRMVHKLKTGGQEERQEVAVALREALESLQAQPGKGTGSSGRHAALDTAIFWQVLLQSGALAHLVRLLEDSVGPHVREASAVLLSAVAALGGEGQAAVSRAGALAPLVKLLRCEVCRGEAVVALGRLVAGNRKGQAAAMRAGAASPLKTLLEDSSAHVRAAAAATVASLVEEAAGSGASSGSGSSSSHTQDSRGRYDRQVALARAGVLEPLVKLLGDARSGPRVHAAAASAVRHLAANNADNQVAIAQAGAIAPLVALLSDREISVREKAAAALAALVKTRDVDSLYGNQAAIAQAGAIPVLVSLLTDSSGNVRTAVATALRWLAERHEGNQAEIANAGAVEPLIWLWREDGPAKGSARGVLLSLASSRDTSLGAAVRATVSRIAGGSTALMERLLQGGGEADP
eukprot:TRINITY_DN44992_c0_g1_i2.p1 TRINITY_DN44992_c0_g1~~TRINITY_DN44992_c0_g1_i2.p1  ORF type:complete len:845 (+),score=181.28 TRINITY_DN44992_c0_g1_i2:207-2741(+)